MKEVDWVLYTLAGGPPEQSVFQLVPIAANNCRHFFLGTWLEWDAVLFFSDESCGSGSDASDPETIAKPEPPSPATREALSGHRQSTAPQRYVAAVASGQTFTSDMLLYQVTGFSDSMSKLRRPLVLVEVKEQGVFRTAAEPEIPSILL